MTPEELAEAKEILDSDCQETELVCDIQAAGQSLLAHIDSQAAQIEALKAELISSYAQEVQFGQSYIKWRYMSGFDSLDYDARLQEAVKKAKDELRGDSMLEKAGVTWDEMV